MSTMSSDDHLNPHSPLYYAPRRVRERPQRTSTSSSESRSERLKRLASSSSAHDALLEGAVADALRHPLDPEIVREPPEYTSERDRRKTVLRIAVRSVAAIGVAAVVASFFVFMVPLAQDHAQQADGSGASLSGIVDTAKAAFNPPPPGADAKPPVSEFETILASSRTEEPAVTHEQSETLLRQFLQWQKKPAQTR